MSAAGLAPPVADDTGPTPMDGVSLWDAIRSNGSSPRTEVVHQILNQYNARDCYGADHAAPAGANRASPPATTAALSDALRDAHQASSWTPSMGPVTTWPKASFGAAASSRAHEARATRPPARAALSRFEIQDPVMPR